MPVRPKVADKAKRPSARDDPLTRQWLDDTYRAAGMLTPEQMRARIAELVTLDRKHTPEERREFKRLVKRWRRDKARQARHERRSEKARAEWAAFTAGERAEWGRRAVEAARRYDKTLTRPALSGEDYHHLHVTMLARVERRNAKELERLRRRWKAEDAAREVERAIAKTDRDEGRERAAHLPSTPPPTAMLEDAERPPRRRIRAGVVATYDMQGNRVS